LIKYNDAARGEAQEAIAYNLLPEHKAFDWQIGYGQGGLESGIGLIAIPSLLKDLDATGVTTEIAIQNVVPKPGFTDFAIFIYDQNGLLDFVCEKLNEKQVEYINLQTWGYVNPGFKGSAIISAVFWEHDVFSGTGFFLRNLVGLAAVSVERTGTALGEDVPGDEAAGARGIPFRQQDVEDAEFAFGFQGPAAPLCPGLPDLRMGPGEGPTCIEPQFGGPWHSEMSDEHGVAPVPVPLFAPCSLSGTPQSYGTENPDYNWDGTGDQILTYQNCGTGDQSITFGVVVGTCTGGGAGVLVCGYQNLASPSTHPFNPSNPCENNLNAGFLIDSGTWTFMPGVYAVIAQTNYIGETCTGGFDYNLTEN
jgi:hypothetical protein